MTVVLNSIDDFDLATLERVAVQGARARFGPQALTAISASHDAFKQFLATNPDAFVYGVTSDFGPHARNRVDPKKRRQRLSKGAPFLGLSFGDGVLGEAEVRALVFVLLALMVRGGTAVHPATAKALAAALKGPMPQIPDAGLTSPGEMMPMFYLYRAVPELLSGGLQASAGNTAATSVGMAGIAAIRSRRRLALAFKVFALSAEAMSVPLEHFDPALKALWGDPFEALAIDAFNHWLGGVPEAGRRTYQAPVSYRILPRVTGQGARAVSGLAGAVETALSSMVSNPMFIPPGPGGRARAISTGGYHSAPVAQCLDTVSASWVDLAGIAHRHIVKLHQAGVSGLPDRLLPEGEAYWTGRSTSYLEFVPNDMIDEMRRWAEPALLSPGEPGASFQDDVSAPGIIASRNEARVAVLFDRVLAVLAAVCSHALHVTGRKAPPKLKGFADAIAMRFPPIEEKRVLGEDAGALAAALTEAVEQGNDLLTGKDMKASSLEPGGRR
ncbi:MAG: aromatic amino acid lyase [Rhizobiales bacterium]|nr:aromatic amino acid lyase [Hyphomicrobiales bacterium]